LFPCRNGKSINKQTIRTGYLLPETYNGSLPARIAVIYDGSRLGLRHLQPQPSGRRG
jgi:hypothetical protein